MSKLQNQALRSISRERARKTIHFGVFLRFWDPLGVELWPMSIFIGGKRAATLPEIQNSIQLKDLGLDTSHENEREKLRILVYFSTPGTV